MTDNKPYTVILVTGGCGFIGSNFIRYLFEKTDFQGHIVNLDILSYAGNPANLSDILERYPDRYSFVHGDIADGELVRTIFDRYRIDCVCHFAAESHVDRSIKSPERFIQTNIIGTYHLLEAALQQKDFTRFHHVSTDEVFGSLGTEGFFTEETPYRPRNPYSATKASSDHLVRAYHNTYDLPITISNCSNNYGPYQFPEKLVPLIVLNALEEKPLPVYGDGKQIRDWLYVSDHCQAIWLVLQYGKCGETYNIGGSTERENLNMIHTICDIVDEILENKNRRNLVRFVNDRPGHDRRYAIDFSKIKKELGWTPSENLDSGLRKTVQWYLKNLSWVEHVRSGEYRNWINQHYGDLS